MSRIAPSNYPPTITIVCTDRGQHEPKRLGEVGASGGIWTIGGDRDRRQADPSWRRGANTQPERCPVCNRTPRQPREVWQKIFAAKAALGESQVDVSYMP
ncbi:hypothetical protein [Kribbella sp.]|uniref:hypothetical protein n=1 Tax=Kribbella sp. TaxID=1871183 RepID=UPI002D4DFDAA|nr:hypothetical protein [Kribbella sp.]HZX05681.1 hypothetical protein [Kribbella sp.]